MLKRAGLILLLLFICGVMIVFTQLNTDEIEIDLAFASVTQPVSIVLTTTLVLGWLLGVLSMGLFALKLLNERRALRRLLRTTESEITSLRNLPMSDAD